MKSFRQYLRESSDNFQSATEHEEFRSKVNATLHGMRSQLSDPKNEKNPGFGQEYLGRAAMLLHGLHATANNRELQKEYLNKMHELSVSGKEGKGKHGATSGSLSDSYFVHTDNKGNQQIASVDVKTNRAEMKTHVTALQKHLAEIIPEHETVNGEDHVVAITRALKNYLRKDQFIFVTYSAKQKKKDIPSGRAVLFPIDELLDNFETSSIREVKKAKSQNQGSRENRMQARLRGTTLHTILKNELDKDNSRVFTLAPHHADYIKQLGLHADHHEFVDSLIKRHSEAQ